MNLAELKLLDDKYILNSYKRYPLQIAYGKGVYVYDENDKKYLDFLGGIAVNALGYSHPEIVKVINEQSEKLIHTSNLFYTETPVMLAKKLCEISSMQKVFFCNSGAEANELAIKLAMAHGNASGKTANKIVCMNKSFHGRTLATLSITKSNEYGKKFSPLMENTIFIDLNDKDMLRNVVNNDVSCIIIEPIQGEGGINVANKGYLEMAKTLSSIHNCLLILDEVQTGLGRTGDYFAYESSGIVPDVITLAKPLGAGLPIGAVLMTDKVSSLITYGDHGSTFGANGLSTACALKFIELLESDSLLNNVKLTGNYFFDSLSALKDKYSFIKEIKGRGLILGLELNEPASDFIPAMLNEGLIANCTDEKVIRFLPPYIITKEHVDAAVAILDKLFAQKKT